jgi:hypothetical protein
MLSCLELAADQAIVAGEFNYDTRLGNCQNLSFDLKGLICSFTDIGDQRVMGVQFKSGICLPRSDNLLVD